MERIIMAAAAIVLSLFGLVVTDFYLYEYGPVRRMVFSWLWIGVVAAVSLGLGWWPLAVVAALSAVVLLIGSFTGGPRRRDEIFEAGKNMGNETIPTAITEVRSQGRGEANILRPFRNEMEARQFFESPPDRYWSLIFFEPMVSGKVHEIRCNFSPSSSWFETISAMNQDDPLLTVSVIGPSFFIKPETRKMPIKSSTTRIKTDFLITPQKRGRHPLRIEVYAGDVRIGWRQTTISVVSNVQSIIATIVTIVGILAGVISILKGLKLL